jgi:hypothetical protein
MHLAARSRIDARRSFRVPDSPSSQPATPATPYSPSASASSRRGAVPDPLMQYINSTLAPSSVSRSATADNLESWELAFSDIVMEQPVGEGSWGRVYKAKWCV